MLAIKIDRNGFYIPGSEYESELKDGIPQPPNGFWKPLWDGTNWVEGATLEEIGLLTGQPQTVEEIKKVKQQEIISYAATLQESLIAGYSPAERDTWDFKERQARNFLETGDIQSAKYLRAEVIAMTNSTDEVIIANVTQQLANKIVTKADELRLASATISGTRARKCAEITALTDIKEVMNYNVSVGWD